MSDASVLVIKRVLDKSKVQTGLCLLLLILLAFGVLAGFFSHNVDRGIAVNSGNIALITLILTLIVWIAK